MSGWEDREKEIRDRMKQSREPQKNSLPGFGMVPAQDVGDLLTEIERLRRDRATERATIVALHPLLADAFDKDPSLVPRIRALASCYEAARSTEEYAIGLSHGTKRGAAWLRAEIVRLEAEVERAKQRCPECRGGGIVPSIGGLWANCRTCGHRDEDE